MSLDTYYSWCECFCPCLGETANRYRLTSTDESGFAEKFELGFIVERPDFCPKFICQCWRPLHLSLVNSFNNEIFETHRKSNFHN